jgi:trans-aconitate methyltransferase
MTDVLYGELARYYDRIYQWKDYGKDIERLLNLLEEHGPPPGNELLDIGCGTGNHVALLTDAFECTGVDVEEPMLAIAREKVPSATFINGDMRTLDLGRRFDVVTSFFGTLGYSLDEERLGATVSRMAGHLRPGGVLVVDPWYPPDRWIDGLVNMTTVDEKDLKIARVGYSTRVGKVSRMELHYLVSERGVGVRHLREVHEMGLFEVDLVLDAMRGAGLDPVFLEEGFTDDDRGTYVAVKGAD